MRPPPAKRGPTTAGSRRPSVSTPAASAATHFRRASSSERRRRPTRSKEWPIRKAVDPAFGTPSLKIPVNFPWVDPTTRPGSAIFRIFSLLLNFCSQSEFVNVMWVCLGTGIVANNGTGEVSVDQYHRYQVNSLLFNQKLLKLYGNVEIVNYSDQICILLYFFIYFVGDFSNFY